MSPVTGMHYALGSYETFQPSFRDEKRSTILVTRSGAKFGEKSKHGETKILTYWPIIARVTLKAVSLQLNGCSWYGKYCRQCKTMLSGTPEFIPLSIPVTGVKCSYGKLSSPLTEISVEKTEISETEPVRPLIWTHRKFYKGFRDKAGSRKPGQPGQLGSCEGALRNRVRFSSGGGGKKQFYPRSTSIPPLIAKRKHYYLINTNRSWTWV